MNHRISLGSVRGEGSNVLTYSESTAMRRLFPSLLVA
jgi:hypothetical protein